DLSLKTNNEISQSVISTWENKSVDIPSINNIMKVVKALDLSLQSVPFEHFYFAEKGNNDSYVLRSDILERFGLYELHNKAKSVKTFCGKAYEVKGFVGVESETGEIKNIADLYYNERTVIDIDNIISGKRINQIDQVTKLKKMYNIKYE